MLTALATNRCERENTPPTVLSRALSNRPLFLINSKERATPRRSPLSAGEAGGPPHLRWPFWLPEGWGTPDLALGGVYSPSFSGFGVPGAAVLAERTVEFRIKWSWSLLRPSVVVFGAGEGLWAFWSRGSGRLGPPSWGSALASSALVAVVVMSSWAGFSGPGRPPLRSSTVATAALLVLSWLGAWKGVGSSCVLRRVPGSCSKPCSPVLRRRFCGELPSGCVPGRWSLSAGFVSPPVASFYCGVCSPVWRFGLHQFTGVGTGRNGDGSRHVMPDDD